MPLMNILLVGALLVVTIPPAFSDGNGKGAFLHTSGSFTLSSGGGNTGHPGESIKSAKQLELPGHPGESIKSAKQLELPAKPATPAAKPAAKQTNDLHQPVVEACGGAQGCVNSCECPDGTVYIAAEASKCNDSRLCSGGVSGQRLVKNSLNIFHATGGGNWFGGICTCPDGVKYLVGDHGDSCEELFCEGGTPGTIHTCHGHGDPLAGTQGPWKGGMVSCTSASDFVNLDFTKGDIAQTTVSNGGDTQKADEERSRPNYVTSQTCRGDTNCSPCDKHIPGTTTDGCFVPTETGSEEWLGMSTATGSSLTQSSSSVEFKCVEENQSVPVHFYAEDIQNAQVELFVNDVQQTLNSTCADWDVRLTSYPTGQPEFFLDDDWHPVCGFVFWFSSGPDTICKKLGYSSGTLGTKGTALSKDGMGIGGCHSGQWGLKHKCTGGNNFYDWTPNCKAGHNGGSLYPNGGGFTVTCSGGTGGAANACSQASQAGSTCTGPACRFSQTISGSTGSNGVVVVSKPAVGHASTTRFRLKIENVADSFSECEDNKVCLGANGLGDVWDQDNAKNLRSSIYLQWTCLQGSLTNTVCTRWKNCLGTAGRLQDIQNTLTALNAHLAPQLAQLAGEESTSLLAAQMSTSSAGTCRNPFLFDPESWDCSCHEMIKKACSPPAYTLQAGETGNYSPSCYKTKLCQKAGVCTSWKTAVSCPGYGEEVNLLEESAADDLISLIAESDRSKTKVGWDCG